jgi:hypothetical protein
MYLACCICLSSSGFSSDQNVEGTASYTLKFRSHRSRLLACLIAKDIFSLMSRLGCRFSLNSILPNSPRSFALARRWQNDVLFCF